MLNARAAGRDAFEHHVEAAGRDQRESGTRKIAVDGFAHFHAAQFVETLREGA